MRRRRIVLERKKLDIKIKNNLLIEKNIAFIIPVTSRKRNYKDVYDTDFYKIFFQSFLKTCSSEYNYGFYLGYDHDDQFYLNNLEQMQAIDPRIKMIKVENLKNKVGKIWSILAQKAVTDNYDWLYQIGDDIEILDKNWENAFINKLLEMQLLGVVGPNDINTTRKLLTQSFVHFTHLLIFKSYYPSEINNWYIDDWISIALDQYHFNEYRVKNIGGCPRYDIDNQKNKYLKIATNDRKRFLNLKEFLKSKDIITFKTFKTNKLFIIDKKVYLFSPKALNYKYTIEGELNYGIVSRIAYMNNNISYMIDDTKFVFVENKKIIQNSIITEDDLIEHFVRDYRVYTRKHDVFKKSDYVVLTGNDKVLTNFFTNEAYKIGDFTLITVESDFFNLKKEWLELKNLKGWYTWNKPFSHPKLHALPIGLNKDRQLKSYLNYQNKNLKNKLLLINFSPETHIEREQLLKIAQKWDFATKGKKLPNANTTYFKSITENCNVKVDETNYEYFNYLSEFKFVLSPRGAGIDCHRTWEALYVNTIPIVRSDSIDELYKNLPILIINDWNEINEEFLNKKYEEISQKEFNKERLTLDYWLHKIENKNLRLITYGNNLYYDSKKRLIEEAIKFNVFDTVKDFGFEDLSDSFVQKYIKVLEQNRGGGYWIWKLDVIEQSLKNMIDGQILIYLDAGCSFNLKGKKRFNEYIELLKKSKYDILSFQMQKEIEKEYTTKEIFNCLNVDIDGKEANSGQFLGGVLIMKKGKHLRLLLDKYWEVLNKNMYLFTDKYNKNQEKYFKDNRHDQSVFSLIRKKYGSEVIIGDETWFDDFNSEKALKYPIHALRKK